MSDSKKLNRKLVRGQGRSTDANEEGSAWVSLGQGKRVHHHPPSVRPTSPSLRGLAPKLFQVAHGQSLVSMWHAFQLRRVQRRRELEEAEAEADRDRRERELATEHELEPLESRVRNTIEVQFMDDDRIALSYRQQIVRGVVTNTEREKDLARSAGLCEEAEALVLEKLDEYQQEYFENQDAYRKQRRRS